MSRRARALLYDAALATVAAWTGVQAAIEGNGSIAFCAGILLGIAACMALDDWEYRKDKP